jgi:SARP family transcriptional regulator, regulator of embCAB operon
MSNAGLQFGVLGPLQLRAGDALVPLGAPKQRAVLATLLMNRNRAVSVDALIDAVWDQSPVPAARTSIHSYVSNLRRLLGSGSDDPNSVLASVPPGYQLNVADADCDIARFVTEKNAGVHAAAAGRFEDASTYLSAALAEWRGPLLDDLREFPFVDTFATALSEVRVAVQTALAEAEIACGRADAMIPRLEALSAEHPFRERLWAQLITACGRPMVSTLAAGASGAAPPWPTATISAAAATSSYSKFAPAELCECGRSQRKNFARMSPGSIKAGAANL